METLDVKSVDAEVGKQSGHAENQVKEDVKDDLTFDLHGMFN